MGLIAPPHPHPSPAPQHRPPSPSPSPSHVSYRSIDMDKELADTDVDKEWRKLPRLCDMSIDMNKA